MEAEEVDRRNGATEIESSVASRRQKKPFGTRINSSVSNVPMRCQDAQHVFRCTHIHGKTCTSMMGNTTKHHSFDEKMLTAHKKL